LHDTHATAEQFPKETKGCVGFCSLISIIYIGSVGNETMKGKMPSGIARSTVRPAHRKYLRGAIMDAELRKASEKRLDMLPDSAFVGERVRSFIAVSSWFWYCYPCAQKDADTADSGLSK
jgi:hypothetical protein